MAVREIELDSEDPAFDLGVSLDGVRFTLSFEWAEYAGAWFVSLWDADDVPLISGARVVTSWPWCARFRRSSFPAGQLVFLDPTNGGPPGRNELGARVRLYYVDAAGVDA